MTASAFNVGGTPVATCSTVFGIGVTRAAPGGLENVAYGLYRVPDMPTHEFDQFAEALLRAGDGAFLHGESVLALFSLADVNPRQIKVAVRKRTRPKLPRGSS